MPNTFDNVLIANRGEIAVRLVRACHELGLSTVAVYSEADAQAPHVQLADQAVLLQPADGQNAYLNTQSILAAAQRSGAQALHPGYGFLSENADFARACEQAGLVFIGPSAEAIARMGSKTQARELVASLGLPVIPGFASQERDPDTWLAAAEQIGYPLLIKAAAGGGGRGMRRVVQAEALPTALAAARREAMQAFGNDEIYLEAELRPVRHIEFQILGDSQGHLIHCLERECSLQRRYQKLLEERPAPGLSPELRAEMGAAAVKIGKALGYLGAGTVEFVLDACHRFYFLEVNTRLQVEHPVTEMTTGLDLVHWQLRLAQGLPLTLQQAEIVSQGHAIECRICAEDPRLKFQPATGTLHQVSAPTGPGVRFDSGVQTGSSVGIDYDSMLAKLIVWGPDREQALQRLRRALRQTLLAGLHTNQALLEQVLQAPDFIRGQVHTGYLEQHLAELLPADLPAAEQQHLALVATLWGWQVRQACRSAWQAVPSGWRHGTSSQQSTQIQAGETYHVNYQARANGRFEMAIGDKTFDVQLWPAPGCDGSELTCSLNGLQRRYQIYPDGDTLWIYTSALGQHPVRCLPRFPENTSEDSHGGYCASLPAKILQVLVRAGETVSAGQALVVMESMKMETTLCAASAGTVLALEVSPGDRVEAGTCLLQFQAAEAAPAPEIQA